MTPMTCRSTPSTVVPGLEGAAPPRPAAEHREEVRGDRAPDETHGLALSGEVELRIRAHARDLHGAAQLLQGDDGPLRVEARQPDEPLGRGIGKRPEKDGA